jgi:uncharacterized membrane protein
MENLFSILLPLHIGFGFMGLLIGTFVLMLKKGDPRHKRLGRLFAISMGLSAGVSFALVAIHPNTFLFLVGLWTIYLAGTGYAYVRLSSSGRDEFPRMLLRVLALVMLLTGVVFVSWGGSLVVRGGDFGIVLLAFGGAGLLFVRQDLLFLRRGGDAGMLVPRHLQRMTGAYIAALTAFLVVNTNDWGLPVPGFVWWLLPSAVLTPLIVRWSARWGSRP